MAYKEIVTKAVIGKGKKKYKDKYEITVEEKPTTILGCWIINHNFEAKETNNKIVIDGSFDANIWYSYNNDTKTTVVNKKITYQEEETLIPKDNNIVNKDIIVRSLKQPTCIRCEIVNNEIEYTIEKELGIEIVGDVKVKISYDEEEDPWQVIEESKDEIIDKEIDQSVKENYLDNKN